MLSLRIYSRAAFQRFTTCSSVWSKSCSNVPQVDDVAVRAENFDDMVENRRSQAQRSVIVQMTSTGSTAAQHLLEDCSQIGIVKTMMEYHSNTSKPNKKQQKMYLVEFTDKESVDKMLLRGAVVEASSLPVRSPFLTYQGKSDDDGSERSQTGEALIQKQETISEADLMEKLALCDTISEQIKTYHHHRKFSDLDVRLSFITCRQLELALSGLFPFMRVLPFGSSVNGFGHSKSDLDMIIELQQQTTGAQGLTPALHFQAKGPALCNNKPRSQVFLEFIADLFHDVMPGCSKVYKILRARVPIVKYHQDLTNMECDITVENPSGVYMSALLYQYSALDPRVGPLVFAVRLWARELGLTSTHPGRWITNFSLSLMVLYYLIRRGLLPPIQLLKDHARPRDYRMAEGGIECTFLRDLPLLASLHPVPPGQESCAYLLLGFFQFYDEFCLQRRGFSLVTGKDFVKPVHCAIYIENPIHRELNVTANVSLEELDRISSGVRQARQRLEVALEHGDQGPLEEDDVNWGLLSLFGSSTKSRSKVSRLHTLDVSDLFAVKEQQATASSLDSNIFPKNKQHNTASKKKSAHKGKSPR